MKVNLNPAETVTILDSTGSQTTALASFEALLLEANRLGINLDSGFTVAGLAQAVRQAGGHPGLLVTRNGAQVTMEYAGLQNFERFDVWVDGTPIDQWAAAGPHTTTIPLLPAGSYQVVVAASWSGVPGQDPGQRISFPYTSDGAGYVQPHPAQVPARPASGLQPVSGNYIRSVFAIDSLAVLTNPAVQIAYRSGAFTDIEEGVFDFVSYPDAASAMAQFNARWSRVSQVCHDYGLKVLCLGDDLVRGPGTVNITRALSDWRPSVISQAATIMQQSGYLRGILMVDEADLFANDASDAQLDQLIAILKSAPGLQLTWPVHNPSTATRFTSRSDWLDLYWTVQENRYALGMTNSTTASSMPQIRADMQLSVMQPGSTKAFSILNSIMAGSNGFPSILVIHVTAQIFLGWCFGGIGVRSYTFDYGSLPDGQIGATPAAVGADRWTAMQVSYALIGQLEQRFGFGSTMVQDTSFDPDVIKTTRGNVTIAINCSEGLRSVGLLPAPAYRLLGSVYQTGTWTGNLQPAEVAVWVLLVG